MTGNWCDSADRIGALDLVDLVNLVDLLGSIAVITCPAERHLTGGESGLEAGSGRVQALEPSGRVEPSSPGTGSGCGGGRLVRVRVQTVDGRVPEVVGIGRRPRTGRRHVA